MYIRIKYICIFLKGFLDPILTCLWKLLHTNKQFLGTTSTVSVIQLSSDTTSTLRYNLTAQVQGLGPQDSHSPLLKMPVTSPGSYLYF